jgi:dTDP-D-glucose 4,6-dehydratase
LFDLAAFILSSTCSFLSTDLRYTVNSEALKQLGWKELVSWEDGLNKTVDWYKQYKERYGNIDCALEAHPRSGALLEFS